MKILGIGTGHDAAYCILEDGKPLVHNEWERFSRVKEEDTDVIQFVKDTRKEDYDEIRFVTHWPHPKGWHNVFQGEKLKNYVDLIHLVQHKSGSYSVMGHHQSHAANAFFSSNCKESLIVTLDAGGWDFKKEFYLKDGLGIQEGAGKIVIQDTACTVWEGKDINIKPLEIIPLNIFNIGGAWHDMLISIFGLSAGPPIGNQAGTIMAMAAVGDPSKYVDLIKFDQVGFITGLHKISALVKESDNEDELFNVAAALQLKTEQAIKGLLENYLKDDKYKNLCIAGGVALNCVTMGKILDWFPQLETVYVPPVPYDGGLPIGTAQFLYHQVYENPRIEWSPHFTPYLGRTYSEVEVLEAITEKQQLIDAKIVDNEQVADLLAQQNIISVFGGGSESGRRALGHRSILADPRNPKMKDIINEKVKHRQWFRPFAPSILREEVKNWFVHDVDSPYMNFALEFLPHAKDKVPAVVHFNNTGRLQTVTEEGNPWYYKFIKTWFEKSGVPMVLNTSFNDREPIVETPVHAINCFLKTKIDYLYFTDYNILLSKKG